jgi:cytochrome c
MRHGIFACLMIASTCFGVDVATAQDAAAAGDRLFKQRCGACHPTKRNGVGPHLQGIVGRSAGSVEGFNYSPALKSSGITWTPEALHEYLAGPAAMIPGTKMVQRFNKADERRAIIEYLQSQ